MFYLEVWQHENDGDFTKLYFKSNNINQLVMTALLANPNESQPQETTEWSISNAWPDGVEVVEDVKEI